MTAAGLTNRRQLAAVYRHPRFLSSSPKNNNKTTTGKTHKLLLLIDFKNAGVFFFAGEDAGSRDLTPTDAAAGLCRRVGGREDGEKV